MNLEEMIEHAALKARAEKAEATLAKKTAEFFKLRQQVCNDLADAVDPRTLSISLAAITAYVGHIELRNVRAEEAEAKLGRMTDLVRHQRGELFREGLITKEEYTALATTHGGVQRLETYDALRARAEKAESELDCGSNGNGEECRLKGNICAACYDEKQDADLAESRAKRDLWKDNFQKAVTAHTDALVAAQTEADAAKAVLDESKADNKRLWRERTEIVDAFMRKLYNANAALAEKTVECDRITNAYLNNPAESEAREVKLREALKRADGSHRHKPTCCGDNPAYNDSDMIRCYQCNADLVALRLVRDALAMKADNSALVEAIQAERDACAKEADKEYVGSKRNAAERETAYRIGVAIRARTTK